MDNTRRRNDRYAEDYDNRPERTNSWLPWLLSLLLLAGFLWWGNANRWSMPGTNNGQPQYGIGGGPNVTSAPTQMVSPSPTMSPSPEITVDPTGAGSIF